MVAPAQSGVRAAISTGSDAGGNGQQCLPPQIGVNGPSTVPHTPLQLETGTCSLKGLKMGNPGWVNQDTHLILELEDSLVLVCVFDGHGENGRMASDRVKELFEQFSPTLFSQGKSSRYDALCQLFAIAQNVFEREGMYRLSGTTCTVALIDQAAATMMTAHVGDSKLMLVKDTQVEFESRDHVIDDDEDRRVTACGGEVRELDGAANAGTRRIFIPGQNLPGLAMSRSLGDLEAHNVGALATPDISGPMALKPGSTLIVASDGVWDRLPREFIAANVAMSKAESSAHAMAFAARARWSPEGDIDDITAVVVHVHAVTCGSESRTFIDCGDETVATADQTVEPEGCIARQWGL